MNHQEINRITSDSDTAVLFIHGILGTPNHFKAFLSLIPQNYSVCSLLLKGHGGDVRSFSKAKMCEWKAQVTQKVEELSATHQSIFIVAHSMGTLFALQQAYERPASVKRLFLLAAPLKIHPKPLMFKNTLKVFFNKTDANNPVELAAKNAYSLHQDHRIWRYLGWIPRYLELFAEIRRIRKLLSQIKIPCDFYQSKKDEMVSLRACEMIKSNPNFNLHILEKSSHYYYHDDDFVDLLNDFQNTITQKENL